VGRLRILFSSVSGAGHVQPVLPLAQAAMAAGHEVLWATGADAERWVTGVGVAHADAGPTTRDRMAAFLRLWPEAIEITGEERAAQMFPRLFGAVAAPAAFPALLELARRWQPDIVVSEAADFAAPVVAAAVGVPQVTHGFGLVVPPERVQAAAERSEQLWAAVGLEPRPYGGCYDHLYIDIYPPSLQAGELAHIPRIQRRRPRSSTGDPAAVPAPIRAFLADGRLPLAYLTFGTVFNEHDTFGRAVEALGRIDDLRALVTVGPAGDPTAFGDLPDRVRVERYVSQQAVLPRCAVVASHAGSGTFLAALGHGVPQVCLPQAADQFRNAGACHRSGAGLSLPERPSTEEIEAAVRAVLTDAAFATRAADLAAEIEAMPDVDAALAAVESLVS
jgi:UDP:flavonoid glycosyltransferase YjiC (YdhE family)